MAVTADKVVVELELKDGQYLAKVKQAESQFSRSQDRMASSAKNAERQIKASSGAIGAALTRMAGTIAAAASVGAIVKMGDAYTSLQNRMKALGLEGEALAATEEKLYAIANKNGVAIDGVSQLYQRASMARENLGASEADLMKIVSGVSASLRIQGTSATQASGALLQLGQLMGGVTVQATEYNSLIDGMPTLLQAAANGSDKWAGSVSKMNLEIKEGKTSTREFVDALLKGLGDMETKAQSLPLTVGGAMQILNDNLGRYVGQTDQSLSATARLAQGIEALANNLDRVIPALTVIAGAFALRWAAGMTAAAVASDGFAAKAWSAAQQAIAAEKAKTAAVAVETRTRTMLLNAEVLALQRQVATGRSAQGQFINMAAAQTQLNASTRALAGSLPAATAATLKNSTALVTAGVAARGFGSALIGLAGGPVSAAIMATVAAIGWIVTTNINAKRTFDNLEASVDATADEYERAAAAAKALGSESGKLANSQDTAAVSAASLTGEISKLADQHYRAAAAAKAQIVETLRLKAVTAGQQTSDATERFRNMQRQAQFRETRRDSESRRRVAQQVVDSREFKVMQTAAENTRTAVAQLRAEMERPLSAYLPTAGGGDGGNGDVKGAKAAVDSSAEEAKRAAEELARSLADIQYSLLSDAEKAAKELAEQTAILNQAVEKGLITGRESQVMQGGLAAQGLQGYDPADIKPIGQEIMRPFQDFADELAREQEQVAGNMARTFTDILASGNIGEAIGNEFKRAAFNGLEIIMKELLLAALPAESGRGFLSQIFGFGGNRASGGVVRAGSSYTVGENGRETFVPSQNGYIIPNMKNMSVGGGQPSVVKLIVDEGAMFSARVEQISGPIAVNTSVAAASYSQDSMRVQRRRQSQSFVR